MKNIITLLTIILLTGCGTPKKDNGKLQVVTTTTMITDLLQQIGGDQIEVKGLMGSGVDPHLYKATEGDFNALTNADVIFYNGLHLEGKLVDVFEKMNSLNKTTIAVSDVIDPNTLISSENFASSYDPHIWFDIDYWKQITTYVTDRLIELDPTHQSIFENNKDQYLKQLTTLDQDIKTSIDQIPTDQRILVTAHDAFNYLGRRYGVKVVGLQGISTATEAGVKDVQRMTQFIIDHNVTSIFIETSVPRRTVEALQAAVNAQDHKLLIGGELYSDALGSTGTSQGTYIGMYYHNIETIVKALKK